MTIDTPEFQELLYRFAYATGDDQCNDIEANLYNSLITHIDAKIAEKVFRIERLRGALKSCSGRFVDHDDLEYSNLCLDWAGDIEP